MAWRLPRGDRSISNPSVACGPASLGQDNCIIAYATGWGPTLHWVYGHVDPVEDKFIVNLGTKSMNGYVVHGGPKIAYVNDATYPWVVTFHQSGNWVYALTKGPSITENFSYRGFYYFGASEPWAGPAMALGSWCTNTWRGVCVSWSTRVLKFFGISVEI